MCRNDTSADPDRRSRPLLRCTWKAQARGTRPFRWATRAGTPSARCCPAVWTARASRLRAQDAKVDLPDSGGNRLKEQQASGRVVLDDAGDEAETIAFAYGIRNLGAREVQVKDVHI